MKGAPGHIVSVAVLLGAFFGLPAARYLNVSKLSTGVDTVSSATLIQEAPSGTYLIFINRDLHTNSEALANWRTFFAGGDVGVMWEDISCTCLEGDTAGIEMAESLASRLPANQMKIHVEDGTLALSKAEAGRFDVLVMSSEAASVYGASGLEQSERVEAVSR